MLTEVSSLPEAAPLEGGVSLEQYAGILAALDEGLPLADALAQEGISVPAWRSASAAWATRLAGDSAAFALFQGRFAEAVECLERRVAPLDDDLEAWCGLRAALAAKPDPAPLLAALELGPNDLVRLEKSWQRRFEQDPSLGARASEAARRGPALPPWVTADPPRLRPFPWTKAATPASSPPGPAAEGAPSMRWMDPSPRVVASSPDGPRAEAPLARRPSAPPMPLHGSKSSFATLELSSWQLPKALPFVAAENTVQDTASRAALAPGTLRIEVPRRLKQSGKTEELRAYPEKPALPPSWTTSGPGLDVDAYAALHVELLLEPKRRPETLARFGVASEGAYSDVVRAFRARFLEQPEILERWLTTARGHRATMLHARGARDATGAASLDPEQTSSEKRGER